MRDEPGRLSISAYVAGIHGNSESPPILGLILGLCLAGCAPTPRLAVPPIVLSQDWAETTSRSGPVSPTIQPAAFWPAFGSPILTDLIAEARAANASLDAARERVVKARADIGIARAALLPTVSANAGFAATRTDNTGAPIFAYSAGSAGLDIAYDLDLFGGARAGKRAAVGRYAATRFDTAAAALVIETDVARSFVQYAALCDRIALVDRNLTNARDLLRIIDVRRREGVATMLDYRAQSVEVSKFAATRTTLDQSRRRILAALAVLLGREAPGFTLNPASLATFSLPGLDPGQPGELLFRRPDILAAEARIAAARGDVDQARAAFKPSLKLSASALGQAATLAGPFGATLSLTGGLIAPIFQGGRLRSQLEGASASQRESVALYRQALLTALAEGNNALAAIDGTERRVMILAGAISDARSTTVLARRQYIEGEADLGTVLDAQRSQIAVEDSYALAREERLIAAIDLYKALGGTPNIDWSSADAIATR